MALLRIRNETNTGWYEWAPLSAAERAALTGGGDTALHWHASDRDLANATGTLAVARGGTGLTALGTANQVLGVNAAASGLEYKTLTGTTNQVNVTHGAGSITLSLPQNVHTAASPTFAGLTLSGLTSGGVLFAGSGGLVSQDATKLFWDDTNKRLGVGTSAPAAKLHVSANASTPALQLTQAGSGVDVAGTGGTWQVTKSGAITVAGFKLTTGAAAGYVLTSDASGTGTWQAPSGLAGQIQHNSLAGLQGGASGDYQHLTTAQVAGLHARQHAIDAASDHTGISITSPSAGQLLRYDGINWTNWTPTYITGVAWGQITGTLANQTDLQSALNAKQNSLGTGTTSQFLRGDLAWTAVDWSVLTGKPGTFPPSQHTHNEHTGIDGPGTYHLSSAQLTGLTGGADTTLHYHASDRDLANATGVLAVARGGTGGAATPTAGAVAYGTGTAYAFNAQGVAGQFLRSGGSGAPTWFDLFGSHNAWTGQQTVSNNIVRDGAAGTHRLIVGTTAGSNRWALSLGDTAAETGSNAGSNCQLIAYNDAGAYIAPVMVARRDDLRVRFPYAPTLDAAGATSLVYATSAVDQWAVTHNPADHSLSWYWYAPGGVGTAGNKLVLSYTGQLTLPALTAGGVLFAGSGGTVTQNASKLFWDSTNLRLGVGTNAPAYTLDVAGTARVGGELAYPGGSYVDKRSSTVTTAPTWVRVAQGVGKCSGLVEVRCSRSGIHSSFLLAIGCHYGDGAHSTINVLSQTYYANIGVTKARLLTAGSGDTMYVEVYAAYGDSTYPLTLEVRQLTLEGWQLVDHVPGSVPQGYSEYDHSVYGMLAAGPDGAGFRVLRGGGVLATDVEVDGAAGNYRWLWGSTSGVARWRLALGDATAESGSNAGSDFGLFSYSDAGAYLRRDLTISRATGQWTIAGNLAITPLTAGSVPFVGAGGLISQNNAKLYWDNSNYRLGIGTSAPSQALNVYQGNVLITSTTNSNTVRNNGYYVWTDKAFGMELGYGQAGQSSGWALNVFGRSTDGTAIRFGKYAANSGLSTDFTELMTLTTGGNLGIGVVSPAYRLDVGGTTRLSGAVTIGGQVDMGGYRITNLATPAAASDAATKSYVDSFAAAMTWAAPVLDRDLSTPPASPTTGARYIVKPTGTGAWAGHDNQIAEWNGSAWVFTTLTTGLCVYVSDEGLAVEWNGSAWVVISGQANHHTLAGLDTYDDHAQYVRVGGRAGGQTVYGGTGAGDALVLYTTSNATKGTYRLPDLSAGVLRVLSSPAGALSTGPVNLSTEATGVLPVAYGGTGTSSTPTAGGIAYGTGSAVAWSGAGAAGSVLVSGGSGAPTWDPLVQVVSPGVLRLGSDSQCGQVYIQEPSQAAGWAALGVKIGAYEFMTLSTDWYAGTILQTMGDLRLWPQGVCRFDTSIVIPGNAPATSTSPGQAGQIAWDGSYIYVCVAANTWRRAALSSW